MHWTKDSGHMLAACWLFCGMSRPIKQSPSRAGSPTHTNTDNTDCSSSGVVATTWQPGRGDRSSSCLLLSSYSCLMTASVWKCRVTPTGLTVRGRVYRLPAIQRLEDMEGSITRPAMGVFIWPPGGGTSTPTILCSQVRGQHINVLPNIHCKKVCPASMQVKYKVYRYCVKKQFHHDF